MLSTKETKEKESYSKDGVVKVVQLENDVNLITGKHTNHENGSVVYYQMTWNAKTLKSKKIRILTCI